jgi:hypothetical protein
MEPRDDGPYRYVPIANRPTPKWPNGEEIVRSWLEAGATF